MSNAVQTLPRDEDGRTLPMTPMEVVSHAVASGASMETLTKLMELQERYEANQARKAFDEALASAKAKLTPIIKNREVSYEGKNGQRGTSYRHEDMAQIERQVGPILADNGLSYRFKVNSEPNQPVRVTCVIAHRDGHTEETGLSAGADGSGSKNSIQGIGSTITYLQRYTLKAALGLAVAHDDDGARADGAADPISDTQATTLRKLIEETSTDIARFCRHMGIEAIPELPASKFDAAVRQLEAKRARS